MEHPASHGRARSHLGSPGGNQVLPRRRGCRAVELLVSGPTTARKAATNALAGLLASTVLLFAISAALFVVGGADKVVNISAGPMILLAFTVALGCGMFVAIGP